jgi:hypothetical protein
MLLLLPETLHPLQQMMRLVHLLLNLVYLQMHSLFRVLIFLKSILLLPQLLIELIHLESIGNIESLMLFLPSEVEEDGLPELLAQILIDLLHVLRAVNEVACIVFN